MGTVDIKRFLSQGMQLLGLNLDNGGEAVDRLVLYFHELKKWNCKVNLVGRALRDEQILENHFLDSLTLLPLLSPENQQQETLLDVGAGAGFPGLVVKTVRQELPVVLLEPRRNRYYFLKHIIRTLALEEVAVLDVRLERKSNPIELSGRRFSFVTSRAFTDMQEFVSLAAPYLARGGRIVCMKGPGAAEEIRDFAWQASQNFYVTETVSLQLPFSGAVRNLVVIRKSWPGA
jgi:16S rRNA (guanine527-N7)-methyltransferase